MAKRKSRRSSKRTAAAKPAARPLGITIICALNWLISLVGIVGGLGLFAAGTILGLLPIPFVGLIGAFGSLFGIVLLLVSLVSAVVTYWLWNMQQRGYQWVIVFTGISALLNIVSFNIVGLIISGLIIWYLWKNKTMFK